MPSVIFAMLAASALLLSNKYFRQYHKHEKERLESDQKFVLFVENVKSGKWQFTTDKWIEGMRLQRVAAESNFQMSVPFIEFLQFIGWFGFICVGCNILIIFYVRNDCRKRQDAQV